MTPVLVDTSVFIDFFRGRNPPYFKELVNANRIFLSSFVKLELLMGVKKQEYRALNRVLDGLIFSSLNFDILFSKSIEFILKLKSSGLNLGLIDILIAAEAAYYDYPIYTLYKSFRKLEEFKLIELFKEA